MGKNAEFDAVGMAAGEVAVRYMKGEAVEAELLRLNTDLLERLLQSMIQSARRSADARLEGKDADDLLSIVHGKIFKALKAKKYKPQNKYGPWARTVAQRAFLDFIGWRRGTPVPGEDYQPKNRLIPVADTLGDEEREGGRFVPESQAWGDDPEGSLLDNDIFNLVFGAVHSLENDDQAAVVISRVILGQSDPVIADMLDFSPATPKNYYFRAMEEMEGVVREDPDWGHMPIRGLVDLVAAKFELRPGDIDQLSLEQRRAIELARQPGIDLLELADRMGVSEGRARSLVREATVALARLRIRRGEKDAAASTGELAAWLWDGVEVALAAYPRAPARTRSAGAKADELLALSELAIHCLYGGPGAGRAKSLGELVREHLDSSRRKEAAAAFGLPEHKMLGLIADRLPADEVTPDLLRRIASYLRLPPKSVQEAARVPPRRGSGGRTRGGGEDSEERRLHLLRRIRGC